MFESGKVSEVSGEIFTRAQEEKLRNLTHCVCQFVCVYPSIIYKIVLLIYFIIWIHI